jgi:thiamine pyrophosphate-dependent acetolactate synthase large subunit-like protein
MKCDIVKHAAKPVMGWGSDIIAEILQRLGIEYVCVNPGSSFRGLHDSLINYLGNDKPSMLLALHEQSVVAIAHGYFKASGKLMAVVLHSNVGLMAGMMSIFNAWCDRVPILIFGATGAVDTGVRRNWIDWSHTFRDQGALVRHFVKWDEQPTSAAAAIDSVLRTYQSVCTPPHGPGYVILDRRLQEDALATGIEIPEIERFAPPVRSSPSREAIEQVSTILRSAKRPILMFGRVSQDIADWEDRVRLAELLGARVVTDLRTGASFPTDHPLHGGPADLFLSPDDANLLAQADVVLSFDWPDLADAAAQARTRARIIHVSIDFQVHNAYSGDHQRLAPVEFTIPVPPDAMLRPLLEALRGQKPSQWSSAARLACRSSDELGDTVPTLADIGVALSSIREGRKLCLARVPLNWPAGTYAFHEPLDYLGYDGGGGVGSGPGMAVGAALALQDSGRIPVAIMGDGEFLGAASALWTAAHYQIPLLIVVANNRSYFTDEIQQETVARHRQRPTENRWIGQRIDDPPVSIAGIARDFGVDAEGPITASKDLCSALLRGVHAIEVGKPYLIDVQVDPSHGGSFDWLASA